ncbi:MAG: trigger factor [Actinomycetota bacterium]|nr:trigger factor [Actinomycetota bacterium]
MKSNVERVDDTTVKLSITVEASRVGEAIDSAARRVGAEVKVPGFRPGRVPRRVLESRVGKEALVSEAARDALPSFYAEAVRAEQLDVVGPPEFDVTTFSDGQDAEFAATVEVRPDITVPDYAGLQVPYPDWEVTEADVDAQLDQLRERFAELETVQRPVQTGDYAVITVTGERDGQQVEEASVTDLLYRVAPEKTSQGEASQNEQSELDRNLLGAQAGAILKFRDTLGDDYGEDLAGAEVDFTAIVKEVKHANLPDLDDDFAVTASEFDTIDELRDELRSTLTTQKLDYARSALRGRVVEAVSELVDVALPSGLVQQDVQLRLGRLAHQAEQYDISLEQFLSAAGGVEQAVGQLEDEARKTVKAQLVLDAIGKQAGIDVEQGDLGAEVARQAARLGRPPQELAEYMTHPDRLAALVSDAFRRKTIDHVLESVQVLGAPSDPDPDPAATPDPAEPPDTVAASAAAEDSAAAEEA